MQAVTLIIRKLRNDLNKEQNPKIFKTKLKKCFVDKSLYSIEEFVGQCMMDLTLIF